MIRARVKIDVRGLVAVRKQALERKTTLAGMKAAAPLLESAVRAETPVRSGALRAAQAVKVAKSHNGRTASYAVQGARVAGVKRIPGNKKAVPPALYELYVRLGTKPRGGHPGTKANDFRRRAWNRVKGAAGRAAIGAMGGDVRKTIAAAGVK